MPKSKHLIAGRVRSAYEFIKAHRDQYSVQMMCCVAISRSLLKTRSWIRERRSNPASQPKVHRASRVRAIS